MAALSSAFELLGMNAQDLQLTESRTTVYYPGGSYENHLITATYADGRTESVSVPLMMRNPKVAVADLLRPLGRYVL